MSFRTIPCLSAILLSATSLFGTGLSVAAVNRSEPPDGLSKSDWAGISEAYEKGRHRIVANQDGTHQARNPAQTWLTKFDGRGFVVTPDTGGWSWGLELKSYGYPGHALEIAGTPAVKADGGRMEYQHDGNLTEWFINDSRGLEQGWTLQYRPAGSGTGTSLKLDIGVRGGLKTQVSNEGSMVSFLDLGGSNVIQYSGLKAWDADGKSVPVRFEAGETGFRVVADDAGARYPITIDPIAQQANLKASNFANSDRFGCSVAISGYTVVVGAEYEDGISTGVNGAQTKSSFDSNQGAAYVFVRNGTTWTQQAYLKASNSRSSFYFGNSVAISGDTIVVGAPGEYWGEAGINGNQNSPQGGSTGAAYIFTRNGSTWVQQAFVKASNAEPDDRFGCSVSISTNTVVIGATGESSTATGVNGDSSSNLAPRAGAAYVFVRDAITWSQQAYLKASNTRHWQGFGNSVAVSANTIVVGSPYENTNPTGVNGDQNDHPYEGTSYGAAYVFVRNGTSWSQQAYLKDTNNFSYALFGMSVALSGDTVVVGAPGEGNWVTGINSSSQDFTAGDSGAAFVFVRNGSTWARQAYLKASNTGVQDYFGVSVSITGDTVVVGAQEEDSNASGVNGAQGNDLAPSSGAAYVFVRTVNTWSQQAYLKPSSNTGFRLFGNAVAISGGTAVLGAPYEFFPNQPEFPSSGAANIIDGLGSWFSLSTIAANGVATGAGDYKTGSTASLSATPNPGYVFSGWTGDGTGTSNSLQVVVNANKIVTAEFIPDTLDPDGDGLTNYTEVVVQGTNPNVADTDGDGFSDGYEVQFASNPKNPLSRPTFTLGLVNNGIAPGGSFGKSGNLVHGTNATVTATPTSGYQFGSWSGGGSGTSNPLILLMDANKTVGATFVQDTRDPDGDGLDNYNEIVVRGTDPNIADTDADGYSDGYEIQFSTNPKSGMSVPTFTLNLLNDGVATGGSFAKSGSLAHGTNATLTASPLPGYVFGVWGNNASGSTNPLMLLMDAHKTVGATFVQDTRDPDADGLANYDEIVVQGTDPEVADTDGDGYSDGYEIQFSTNPKNAESVPTYSLILLADGMTTEGSFSKSGSLAHGTNATLTSSPSPGYQFGSWTGSAAGSSNPLTLLMDSNKTVGSTFVPDIRDPDGDKLTNYQEIVILSSNPEQKDTDSDGVADGVEVSDKTDPNLSDTDSDGLTDGVEKKLESSPLRKDSDRDGLPDADEDNDRDGISNGREANELAMNPGKADTDGDGLVDTFAVAFVGKTQPGLSRIGDEVRFDFGSLKWSGSLRIAGALPAGLKFDPATQVLKGLLVGQPGSYRMELQLFDGRSFVRSIPLPFKVAPFPGGLADSYEGLLEDRDGHPTGLVSLTVNRPEKEADASGTWTASLDTDGSSTRRTASGLVTLAPAENASLLVLKFPAVRGSEAVEATVRIESSSPLVDGDYAVGRSVKSLGKIRGFRLANAPLGQKKDRLFTMIMDQGEQDGFATPAGLGWATGSLSDLGEISITGQLGDAQSFKTSVRLSVTGQAIVWVKPYRDMESYLGGIISIQQNNPASLATKGIQPPGLVWFRNRDYSELSYPKGFGPIQAQAGISFHNAPATAAELSKTLGLAKRTFNEVLIEGGGLPDPKGKSVLPESFTLSDNFDLLAVSVPGSPVVPWNGSIDETDGSIHGILKLPASGFGIAGGAAQVSGVLIPGAGFEGIVASGLVKIPVTDRAGAYRTAALVISK